ncbi:leucine-rich repeat and IQ domain-containing 3 [Pelobates cultripes]|uniref:Leucine-rich repeat and IQ domain-containing 3 n=1 Tax=Pelobates cultripes TaxID=61616 RepID=A0AAD1WFI0_PELCU|nr:leucine-rich repeat and IQ domain-containing 3 [Pelobates cultripes]
MSQESIPIIGLLLDEIPSTPVRPGSPKESLTLSFITSTHHRHGLPMKFTAELEKLSVTQHTILLPGLLGEKRHPQGWGQGGQCHRSERKSNYFMLANMDSDYLIVASENLLLERGRTCDNLRTEDLKELFLLYLNQLLLKEVTVLQCCRSLRICNLSNNFITNINSLRACSHLIKLDLSGNQIQKLPDRAFWSELKELKLMYLHDNQIGDVSNIESLSSCPNLAALTLYDTPLSLRKSYRHIVVNSIWSLKALDNYVVSDEEIIEDWSLQDRFRSQNPQLCINMLPAPCTDICLQSEMKDVRDLFTKINHVLAHCSPVLIIQRWIRGFLTRKRLGIISPVKIQKKKIHILHSPRKEDDIDGIHVTKILIRDLSALPFSSDSKTLPVIKQVCHIAHARYGACAVCFYLVAHACHCAMVIRLSPIM